MSKEEEAPTRVTRGALRRMSVDQEPTSTPGTPKKTTTSTKKSAAVLDAIQEGSTGPSDVEEDSAARSTTKGKKETSFVGNKSIHKIKEQEVNPPSRTRAASLTEDNISVLENFGDVRRTPRRRPSQDTTLTPQTAPAVAKRRTRRNSATSDDGSMPTTTPKASKSRLSVAPPTIAEDDEKEDKANSSRVLIAEADLSDLDIRKLRSRSISKSPVPSKNTSMGSQKADEGDADTSKVASPTKEVQENNKTSELVKEILSVSESSVEKTPPKSDAPEGTPVTPVGSVKKQLKDVTFEESTPKQLEKSVYPKTPIPSEKSRKLSEKESGEADMSLSTTSEVIDETLHESPQKTGQKVTTPKPDSPMKSPAATPRKADQSSLDKSIDMSLANLVEDVRDNLNQPDQSMSILGTPKPNTTIKQKSHFAHLREGTFSTPIAKTLKLDEETAIPESPPSKSWTQAVKGTSSDKGIDVFSVRKQEEQQQRNEETKQLNESLKRKSLEKKIKIDDEEEEAEEESEQEEEEDEAPERKSFLDDEAMEVEGYESGDSLDSETRAEMDANDLHDDGGESLGSQDSEIDEEEDEEDDSFIASEGEEFDLLDGSGDDLGSDEEANKSNSKKKHKRIIRQLSSSDEGQSAMVVDEPSVTECESPKKSPKKADLNKTKSPHKTPAKDTSKEGSKTPKKTPTMVAPESVSSSKTPKKTPAKNPLSDDKKEELPSENVNASCLADKTKSPKLEITTNSLTPKKPPTEGTPAKKQNVNSPAKNVSQEESSTQKPHTPSKNSLKVETEQATSAKKLPTKAMVTDDASTDKSDTLQSRKSLPAPALISADFYASAKKAAKRNTIHNVLNGEETPNTQETDPEEPSKSSSNLVTNPAALALAKKNKRLSLGQSPTEPASKRDKRASLPGELPVGKEIQSPLKRKKKPDDESGTAQDSVEPMDVDECEEMAQRNSPEKPAAPQPAKKKPKDLSEFDTSAILARCNEIVRSDKEKRKQSATLKQKKKDEKRKQREEEQQDEAAEADESLVQQKKKKKKKKKVINYLLEELGEKKEDQVAKALQRKMQLLEAKRERKKAKKAAKLQQQLNKENHQGKEEKKEGIGAKFEKKAKKDKKAKKEQKPAVEEKPTPIVKLAVSAFAMYSAQIEELKNEQASRKKPKSKQLKEKNHQPSAAEEVQEALQTKVETKSKKHNPNDHSTAVSESALPNESHIDNTKITGTEEVSSDKLSKQEHHKKKVCTASNELKSTSTSPSKPVSLDENSKKDKHKEGESKKPSKADKKKDKLSTNESSESLDKKKKVENLHLLHAPLKSLVPTNEDEIAALKKSLTEPTTKVIKKQKLSHNESSPVAVSLSESPPRKLKALSRLELGFREEPVTPEHKLLKRNHGFKEEPVTPKTVGFKVSNILPAGQEELQQQAILARKKKSHSNSGRIRPGDVKEPAKGLPLPIWTRSGTFEVQEVSEAKSKKSKTARSIDSDFVPLNVNKGGQCSTDFLVKSLGSKGTKHLSGGTSKAHRIDTATVDENVVNFKTQAIFGKNAHLREKKKKH